MVKKLLVHTRKSIKLSILIAISVLIIIGIISYFYKISYIVTINNEFVGYTDNKSELQAKINEYIENGEEENVAYIQVDNLPEYKACFLKRDIEANDELIYNNIKEQGTTYYRYYAILESQEEKLYVANFEEAEEVVTLLKEKETNNIDSITVAEKYETQMQELTTVEDAVADLYVEKPKVIVASVRKASTGSVNTSTNISSTKVSLGISLSKPVSGIITSRFGDVSGVRSSAHTGLDIAASTGTPISAAASGTVTFSGWKSSYGYLLVITHSDGVQTYYGHCSKLYVSAGTTVSQGETIAAVGSTGNSTGPHLHFEIRVNGIAYNPQNYLY